VKLFYRVHLALLIYMCGAVTSTPLNFQKDSFTASIVAQRRRNLKENKVKQYQIPGSRRDNLKSSFHDCFQSVKAFDMMLI
jgi:hypothetical protein